MHRDGAPSVDVTVGQTVAVEKARLVASCAARAGQLVPLVRGAKRWARARWAPIVAAPKSSGAVCFVRSKLAFESTALRPENKLEVIAALNDKGLKDRSVAMATATPPTTGIKAA